MEKMKISGQMLTNAKKAEEVLAREAAKRLEDALPPDHPLRVEVEKQKSLMGGDLSGLPPGHPLLRALEVAKNRYEEKKDVEKVDAARPEPRKAKKVDPNAARIEARRAEEEETDRRRAVAGEVNRRIEAVVDDAKELFKFVASNAEILNTEPFSMAKMARLRRMLSATERGVSECKLARY